MKFLVLISMIVSGCSTTKIDNLFITGHDLSTALKKYKQISVNKNQCQKLLNNKLSEHIKNKELAYCLDTFIPASNLALSIEVKDVNKESAYYPGVLNSLRFNLMNTDTNGYFLPEKYVTNQELRDVLSQLSRVVE